MSIRVRGFHLVNVHSHFHVPALRSSVSEGQLHRHGFGGRLSD